VDTIHFGTLRLARSHDVGNYRLFHCGTRHPSAERCDSDYARSSIAWLCNLYSAGYNPVSIATRVLERGWLSLSVSVTKLTDYFLWIMTSRLFVEFWRQRTSISAILSVVAIALHFALRLTMTLRITADSRVQAEFSRDAVEDLVQNLINAAWNGIYWRFLAPDWVDHLPIKSNRCFNEAVSAAESMVAAYRENPSDYNDLLSMLMMARDPDTGEGMTSEQRPSGDLFSETVRGWQRDEA
jgi:hypothetical protein